MNKIWIVVGNTDEFGRVLLTDYAGNQRGEVEQKVMQGALKEGFRGALSERLASLGWEIVCLLIEDEWKPIESAPKDGTRILLWDGEFMAVAAWQKLDCSADYGWVKGTVWDGNLSDLECEVVNPTHWKPEPAPPEIPRSTAKNAQNA